MPANTFDIVIQATDKATATIRKINNSVSKMTRPFDEVGKSFKSLGREIGVDKIGKDLAKIGASARNAARGVERIAAPMLGLSGVGTVAGIVALADSWAKMGRSITYSAQNIGIGTTQLQTFQNAAKLAGISTDAATASLAALGNTMQGAVYGRNQTALMVFNKLTGGVKRTKTGAMDVTAEFKAMAAAIYKLPTAQAQNEAAGIVGMTAWLPEIRKGPAAINRDLAVGATFDMTPAQIKSADDFAQSLSKMSLSAKVLGYSVGNALIPALKPLTNELSTWLDKNRALIATDIGAWAKDFGKWIEKINWKEIGGDLHTFVKDVGKVVNALGGVKAVLVEIAAIKAFSFLGGALATAVKLTAAMRELRAVSGAGAAVTAAAGAKGVAAKAGGAAAEGGLLARFGWLGGLLRGAMWAPRPEESPAQFRARLKKAGLDGSNHESYWQKWSDVFHGRTSAPIASHPLMRPALATPTATRGERNNNPGNIKYGAFAQRMGATGADAGGFAIFANASQGINAIGANLRAYGREGFNTPFEIAHRWSTTDQNAYTKHLASLFGGNPNQQLDMTNPKVIAALSNGIITQENGSNPYLHAAPGLYTRGSQVIAGNLHLTVDVTSPPGTKVKATPSANTTADVRVAHTMAGAIA